MANLPVSNIQVLSETYYINDSNAIHNEIYTLKNFEGETLEDKLYNALNTIDQGTILVGELTLTKHFVPIVAKDYRKITILGATITLNINNWIDTPNNNFFAPRFSDCYINAPNNFLMFNVSNLIGLIFDGCYINDLMLYSSETGYVQSFYLLNSQYWNQYQLIKCSQLYDCKIINNRIESALGTIIEATYNQAFSASEFVISNNVIEGRRGGIPFVINNTSKLSINNNYFEDNQQFLNIKGKGLNIINFCNNYIYEPNKTQPYINLTNSTTPQVYLIATGNYVNIPSSSTLFNFSKTTGNCNIIPNYLNYSNNNVPLFIEQNANIGIGMNIKNQIYSGGRWSFEYATNYITGQNCGSIEFTIAYPIAGSSLYQAVSKEEIIIGVGYFNGKVQPHAIIKNIYNYQTNTLVDNNTTIIDSVEFINGINQNLRIKVNLKSSIPNGTLKISYKDNRMIQNLYRTDV